ncbi:hypothetical protein J6T66_03485 [bacterium]|nr:hypothetical protein [bacterium]
MTLNKSTASNGGFWITEFTKWLNNTKQIDVKGTDWEYIVRDWHELDHDETKRDLETLFNKSSNGNYYAQTYAKFFGYTS